MNEIETPPNTESGDDEVTTTVTRLFAHTDPTQPLTQVLQEEARNRIATQITERGGRHGA